MAEEIPARPTDPWALLRLEQTRGQALFGFAKRLGVSDAEAADIVQESLVRVWEAMAAGVNVQNPVAMAFRIVHNLVMDQHRSTRRLRELLENLAARRNEAGPSVDSVAESDIWLLVDRLPRRQRQVVYLRYAADLRFEEIGDVLGISPSAARAHGSSAISVLRTWLTTEAMT